ncbi:fumarylacetoacetate hydrolase family protein [Ramlibacter sp.]|uniref:fumarylacetoacetate hydrolase family protein n=1 Tax=Ramlibacter sp. TaxID=1917967 RepID=UPI003D136D9B
MKFATLHVSGRLVPAIGTGDGRWLRLAPLLQLLGVEPAGHTLPAMLGDVHQHADRLRELAQGLLSVANPPLVQGAELAAPLAGLAKNVFCVGRNYFDHVAEGAKLRDERPAAPSHVVYFSKPPTTIIGPGATIPSHVATTKALDYEAELAVVIGRRGTDIPKDKVGDYIFGYTIVNDVTGRELQLQHVQWFKGKGLDGSCPMGPWIADREDIPDAGALGVRLTVNGELRQNANTRDMIFDVATIVSDLSRGLTLEPGDVIATGTPAGVGFAMDPKRLLAAGDVVEIEIDRIGTLRNTVG